MRVCRYVSPSIRLMRMHNFNCSPSVAQQLIIEFDVRLQLLARVQRCVCVTTCCHTQSLHLVTHFSLTAHLDICCLPVWFCHSQMDHKSNGQDRELQSHAFGQIESGSWWIPFTVLLCRQIKSPYGQRKRLIPPKRFWTVGPINLPLSVAGCCSIF